MPGGVALCYSFVPHSSSTMRTAFVAAALAASKFSAVAAQYAPFFPGVKVCSVKAL